jgi:glyoxylase-like metal-dependent hydrolase (beta-lactamase superfamily II)
MSTISGMKRHHPRLTLTLGSFALLGSAWAFAPTQNQDVPITPHQVSGGIWYLEGRGGNIGVCAGEDGVLMIDDQFEDMATKIRTAVAGIAAQPLELLINTHHHGDHTGGNASLGGEVTILAHENVRRRLLSEGKPKGALPVITYEDGIGIHFNGEDIRVFHVPKAHTDGDSVVRFQGANVVHMGDLFFAGRFPYVDIDAGGSVSGLEAAVRQIAAELPDDVKIIPGHGPLSTKADLARYLEMLERVQALVAEALEAGQTAADMKAAKLLDEYAAWGTGFIDAERFIDILVRDQNP